MRASEATYLRVSDAKVETTMELIPGKLFCDLDRDGGLIGVEFLEPCRIESSAEPTVTPDAPKLIFDTMREVFQKHDWMISGEWEQASGLWREACRTAASRITANKEPPHART